MSLFQHLKFIDNQRLFHPKKQPLELQRLSDTRWVCRYASVNAICRTFDSILLTVEQVTESQDVNKAIEARGLLHQLPVRLFPFLVSLITFDKILTCTKHLSDQLQSSTLNFSSASEFVVATKSLLKEYRIIAYWQKLHEYAVDVAKLHDISITFNSLSTRKRKRPRHLDNTVILQTVGS